MALSNTRIARRRQLSRTPAPLARAPPHPRVRFGSLQKRPPSGHKRHSAHILQSGRNRLRDEPASGHSRRHGAAGGSASVLERTRSTAPHAVIASGGTPRTSCRSLGLSRWQRAGPSHTHGPRCWAVVYRAIRPCFHSRLGTGNAGQ